MKKVKIKDWTSFTTSEILGNDFKIPHCDILTYIREIKVKTFISQYFFRDRFVDKCRCSRNNYIYPQEITRNGFSLLIPHLRDVDLIIWYLDEFDHVDTEINNAKNLRRERKEADRVMSNDPWKHRSEGMKCKTCMWFVKKAHAENSKTVMPVGRCRKNAPAMGGYPVVFDYDWCGAHKLNENAL